VAHGPSWPSRCRRRMARWRLRTPGTTWLFPPLATYFSLPVSSSLATRFYGQALTGQVSLWRSQRAQAASWSHCHSRQRTYQR
jgi:hypothetical protein